MKTRSLPRSLLALTPGRARGQADLGLLTRSIGQAFEAGLPALLLREPQLSDGQLLGLARETLELAARHGNPWVGVHDRVHVARAARADGVHLGFRSLEPGVVRELLDEGYAIGFSAHAHDELSARVGADYLSFGPLKDTPSKRGLLEPTGLHGLRQAALAAQAPIFALGGVTPGDVPGALEAGAAGVAVLSGLLGAPDVVEATGRYLEALAGAGGARG